MKARTIDELIDDVIEREGGYVNHPADRGGPTRWGITEAVARRQGYHDAMRHLPQSDAAAIYRRLYWVRPGYDRIAQLAPKIAAELFDTGINMGTGTASGFLQRALNALNRNAKDYPDLSVDRRIGTKTRAALQSYLDRRGAQRRSGVVKGDGCAARRSLSAPRRNTALAGSVSLWLAGQSNWAIGNN